MKIRVLLSAALAGAMLSCTKTEWDTTDLPVKAGESLKTFIAVFPDEATTKTYLDGLAVKWDSYEEINLFYGPSFSTKFTARGTAEFNGSLDDIEYDDTTGFFAVYPYDAANRYDGASVALTLSEVQTAVAGTFADNLFIMLARAGSDDTHLPFYNLCGGIRFTVAGEDITSVTFRGNGGEILAGAVRASFGEDGKPAVAEVISGKTELTLSVPEGETFSPGEWYYIVAFPSELSKGYTLTFHKSDGSDVVKSDDRSVTIKRSVWGRLEKADEEVNTSVLPPDDEIWYVMEDGAFQDWVRVDGDDWTFVFGANIISDTYKNGVGIIKFNGPVTKIGEYAFGGLSGLTSITLPESVTSIEEEAFYDCEELTGVTIGNGITRIGDYAFGDCGNLTDLTLPESLTHIGEGAFSSCTSLKKFIIPDSVTSIGDDVFNDCTGLTEITIGNSVTSIGERAFENCGSLTGLIIPDAVITIGRDAFAGCTGLTNITIGNSVTSIFGGMFSGHENLTKVVIGNSVTRIGSEAFMNCTSLTDITFGDSVTSIGAEAFFGCTSLTSITFPESLSRIGDAAFATCTALTHVTLPESLSRIGDAAFATCTALTHITLPDSVTEIGDVVFFGCTSLGAFYGKFASEDNRCIVIDGTLTAIAPYGLVSYVIPDSVVHIGDEAFENCTSLTNISIPDSVTSIGNDTFCDCTNLQHVDLGNAVTSVGFRAFKGCTSLAEILIPDSVTDIKDEVFSGCTSLTSVSVGHSVTNLGMNAFSGCTSLTNVVLSSSITSMVLTFSGCTSLTSITLPESVTNLNGTFAGCTSLTDILIPDSVTNISGAFFGCTSLKSVIIPDSVTAIDRTFFGCTGLTSVTIGNSVTRIGLEAFSGCTSLTGITLPKSVTLIGFRAFTDCSSLSEIYVYSDTPPELQDTDAFYSCFALTAIYVPAQSLEDYEWADGWMNYAYLFQTIGPAIEVEFVELDETSVTLFVGETVYLFAMVNPSNATRRTVVWTSSDDAVAAVNEEGEVVALKEGTATITATAGGKSASCEVTVSNAGSGRPEGTEYRIWN